MNDDYCPLTFSYELSLADEDDVEDYAALGRCARRSWLLACSFVVGQHFAQ